VLERKDRKKEEIIIYNITTRLENLLLSNYVHVFNRPDVMMPYILHIIIHRVSYQVYIFTPLTIFILITNLLNILTLRIF